MLIVEVVAAVLVAAAAIAMTLCGIVGLLGILGVVRFTRCSRCGHLGISSPPEPLPSCLHCRHGWLLHPIYQLHHAQVGHSRVRAAPCRTEIGGQPGRRTLQQLSGGKEPH